MSLPPALRAPTAPSEDLELVRRVLAGDREAFEGLYETFFPRVYAYARHRLRGSADAEDATQETLIEVFRSIGGYRGEGPLAAWIFAIARRTLARHRAPPGPGEPAAIVEDVPAAGPSAEDRLHVRALLRNLEATWGRLQPRGLRALELRFAQGLSVREAAQRLGCTEDAVKALVLRLRRGLQRSPATR